MNSGNILIVEDELIISKSISLILEHEGYTCSMVTSGEEALEQIPLYAPDLILMDIGLGGKLDGITTAGIISHQYKVPVIFITDHTNYQVYRQAQTAFPSDYISKPFSEAALVKAVAAAFAKTAMPDMVAGNVQALGERVENGIFVLSNGAYQKVLFSDILYLAADGAYTKIHCSNSRLYTITMSSNNVVAQLGCPAIVKTAKSFYVNIHRVDSITADALVIGTKQIPLTQSFKPDVLSRLKKLVTTNKLQSPNDVFE
ncbi:response regulator transcription factor [Paraflavitalea pollutisoli]|uniref:response regulator transcription factor n=1 Tax=Paraflavitalea pollutisoli TaxID=3034143 RepID=UPI0023ECCFE7|nr:response regulator transcription factor [Paraflavitalea sp. H1-2-19X]